MNFKKELEKILDGYSIVETSHLYHHEHDEENLINQITDLVDREIIGSDLPLKQPFDDKYDFVELNSWTIFRKGANWNKENQRKRLKGGK